MTDLANFTWPGGARLALSIVVNVEEGAEQTIADGDKGPEPVDELGVTLKKPIRMHGNESNYRYGIKAGAPRVMKLLKEKGFETTFTAAAMALERAPWLAREIVAQGHEICCHGHRWVHQFWMKEEQERDFIRRGWQSIEKSCGRRPVGWLSRYLHTENTRRLLAEEGYLYHMDDYSDDFPFWDTVETAQGTKPMVILPYALDSNDMKFWLAPSLKPSDWADYAIATYDWLAEEAIDSPRMMSFGLHLRIVGRPGRMGALKRVFDYVAEKQAAGTVWIAARAASARPFAETIPFGSAPELTRGAAVVQEGW